MIDALKHDNRIPSTHPAHIAELIRILGEPVLLLPCAHKRKKPSVKWRRLTVDAMRETKYLASVARAKNIGVALGATSCNLVSIDFDDENAATAFLERNSTLAETFRTKGKRGCNLWLRIIGPFPDTFRIKRDGAVVGEFRSHNHQTIAWGTHPDGMRYQWLVRKPALTVTFDSIVWFSSEVATLKQDYTQRLRDSDSQEIGVVVSSPFLAGVTVRGFVAEAVPTSPHKNHYHTFHLNRGIRTIEGRDQRRFSFEERIAVFEQWYALALPTGHLRKEQSKDEYLLEFMRSYDSVKTLLGEGTLELAYERAKKTPFPPEAERFSDNRIKLLIGICYQLQQLAGDKPFFLSCRKCASIMGACFKSCSSWLGGLCAMGVLQLVERGVNPKASSYRYKEARQ